MYIFFFRFVIVLLVKWEIIEETRRRMVRYGTEMHTNDLAN